MEKKEIKKKLLDILISKDHMSLQIDVSDVNNKTSLINDFAMDSIQLLELIVAIENRFSISVNAEEVTPEIFDNFSKLVDYIESKTKSATT